MVDESPPVPRLRLGIELAQLRNAARVSGEQAGKALRTSPSTISRIETGKHPIGRDELATLLKLYGITTRAEQQPLLDMAAASQASAWWDTFDDVLPSGFETYVGLEQAADGLRAWELPVVHGLLQTRDYARALIAAQRPGMGRRMVDRLVDLRIHRHALLDRAEPTFTFNVILDEAALRRPIGGVDVLRAQLSHVIEVSERPNVALRVMPFGHGAHSGLEGPFTVLDFTRLSGGGAAGENWYVLYLEASAGNLYETKIRKVIPYLDRYDALADAALTPDESVAFVKAVAKELT